MADYKSRGKKSGLHGILSQSTPATQRELAHVNDHVLGVWPGLPALAASARLPTGLFPSDGLPALPSNTKGPASFMGVMGPSGPAISANPGGVPACNEFALGENCAISPVGVVPLWFDAVGVWPGDGREELDRRPAEPGLVARMPRWIMHWPE